MDLTEKEEKEKGGDNFIEESPKLSEEEKQGIALLVSDLEEKVQKYIDEKDFLTSSDLLAQILEHKVKIYGTTGDELGPTYLQYGRCLLELATQNADVIGSSSKKKEAKNLLPKQDEEKSEKIKIPKKAFVMVDDEDIENSENEDDENFLNPTEDLEIAWEVLQHASLIFERNQKLPELAEAKCLMGSVDMEDGNMIQAKEEFKESLSIREKVFEQTDPIISDTLTFIGLTLLNLNEFKEAKEYFLRAEELVSKQIKKTTEENKIKELENQLLEIKSRIIELNTNPDEYERTKQIVKEQILQTFFGGVEPPNRNLTAPVTDIGIFGSATHKKEESLNGKSEVEISNEKSELLNRKFEFMNGNNINNQDKVTILKPRRITPVNTMNTVVNTNSKNNNEKENVFTPSKRQNPSEENSDLLLKKTKSEIEE